MCLSKFAEGVDYSPINEDLTFSNTNRREVIRFTITDDFDSEGIESFRLELRGDSGEEVNSSLVEILDDESEWRKLH